MFAVVDYVFPHYDVTRVTGVEVKRGIKMVRLQNRIRLMVQRAMCILSIHKMMMAKIMVYRNEDTRWGFPFYFKFGSANLQAQVQALGNEKQISANQVLRLADDDVR